jgi:hypothetical protein
MTNEYFEYATDTDWDRADARQRGSENINQAWVLTDRDVWHKNPFYTGRAVPHPEDPSNDPEYQALVDAANCESDAVESDDLDDCPF